MIHYLCGQASRDEFVATAGREVYEPIIWMNEHLPPTAVVLYVGEARVALARHRVVWATAFDQHPLAAMMRSATTPTDLAAAMRERGITHIYVNQQEWQRLARGYDYLAGFNQPLWDEFLASHASLVHHQRVSDVYALHPSEPGATAREEIGNSKPEIQRKSE
jgi:hypothetical protein